MNKVFPSAIVTSRAKHTRPKARIMSDFNRFRNDEDGSMIILTLFLFIFMLVMAGLGIDTMRHEMERTHLHSTLDSAVLAGAGAPDGVDAKAIVEDYFAKAEMSQYLDAIDPDKDIIVTHNSKKVSARASMDVDTYLMKLSGVPTLTAAAASTAEYGIPKLEIALVLDVSGSMHNQNNNKLFNLQTAAKEFVTTVIDSGAPGDTVISIVPFSSAVTPSLTVFNALTVNQTHSYSTCLRLEDADFNSAAINPATTYKQQIYTSHFNVYDLEGQFDALDRDFRSCYTDAYFSIMPYSISKTALHAKIDSLEAMGLTTGSLGMKWGAALLDPAFQPVAAALRGTGEMDSSLTYVPTNYGTGATKKIIVMMGDGDNTMTYFFNETSPYRGANSDLWKVEMNNPTAEFEYLYLVSNPSSRWYGSSYEYYCGLAGYEAYACEYSTPGPEDTYFLYNSYTDSYHDTSTYNGTTTLNQSEFASLASDPNFIASEQLDWEEAWGLMSPDYYGRVTGLWAPYNDYATQENLKQSDKNTRMQSVCGATKAQGTIVYTIGFEIAEGGVADTQLHNCATTTSHYYRTNGVGISAAFASIASNVQNLRLTQ